MINLMRESTTDRDEKGKKEKVKKKKQHWLHCGGYHIQHAPTPTSHATLPSLPLRYSNTDSASAYTAVHLPDTRSSLFLLPNQFISRIHALRAYPQHSTATVMTPQLESSSPSSASPVSVASVLVDTASVSVLFDPACISFSA